VSAREVLEPGDEAVAVAGGQDEAGVVVAAGHRLERGARGRRETAGQRLAIAAGRRQAVDDGRVAAAGGIEKRHLLVAASTRCRQQLVALAVVERGGEIGR